MKTTTTTITCDTCSGDLSPKCTGYPHEYILQVSALDIALGGGGTYAVICHPPINKDLHFCNIACMKKYGDK